MVTRRQVAVNALRGLLAGSVLAIGSYSLFDARTGANGHEMSTDGDSGCRSGLLERPQTNAFKFINILQPDEVHVYLRFAEADSVDEVVIRANGEPLHTERILGPGRHTVAFDAGEATVFNLEARAGADTVGTAKFYSRCGGSDT